MKRAGAAGFSGPPRSWEEYREIARATKSGRSPARLIDPDVDLSKIDDGVGVASWILPAPATPPPAAHGCRGSPVAAARISSTSWPGATRRRTREGRGASPTPGLRSSTKYSSSSLVL